MYCAASDFYYLFLLKEYFFCVLDAVSKELPMLWIFPYFFESRILEFFPSFTVLDYQVWAKIIAGYYEVEKMNQVCCKCWCLCVRDVHCNAMNISGTLSP